MIRGARGLAVAAALALGPGIAVAVGAAPLSAQVRDTLPQDTARVDTAGATERYLQSRRDAAVRVPLLPQLGPAGPRPALTRIALDRDSLDWSGAFTLGELLERVPGVFPWRAGWLGRPSMPNYQGRGAASVEYFLDGVPFLPLGADSVGVDPSLVALTLLQRVEIERWPGLLRVHLFSRRHDRLAARSHIGAGRGDPAANHYEATLQRRFASGFGFGAAADYLDVSGSGGTTTPSRNTQYIAQIGYVPSAALGFELQLARVDVDRAAVAGEFGADSMLAGLVGARQDLLLRAHWARRPDGLGLSADALAARTSWEGSGAEDAVRQAGLRLGWRAPVASVALSAFNRSRWTPLDLAASAAWSPVALATVTVEGRYQTHDAGRTSRWAGARLGLELPLALSVTGSARVGRVVPAPAILADSARRIADLDLAAAVDLNWLRLEGRVARTGAFAPPRFQPFVFVDTLLPSQATTWLTASGRLAPLDWVSLEGWIAHPRGGVSPDGVPPEHMAGYVTIRSRFLRVFPSGALQVKAQVGAERWGDGILGVGPDGGDIALPAGRMVRGQLLVALESFQLFWQGTNLGRASRGYVPGFPMPAPGNVFGLRWSFQD